LPHMDTGMPQARPASIVMRMRCMQGIVEVADGIVHTVDGQGVLDEVVGTDGEKIQPVGKYGRGKGGRWYFAHTAYHLFVHPQIQGPYGDRTAFESADDLQVSRQMFLLVRRAVSVHVEKLGLVEADPDRPVGPDGYRILRELEITQQTHRIRRR